MMSTSATIRSAARERSPIPLALLDPDSPHVGHRVYVIPVGSVISAHAQTQMAHPRRRDGP